MDKVSILGVNFSNITKKEAFENIEQFLNEEKFHYIVTPNPEIILKAHKDPKYKKILNQADLSIADGNGIIKMSKMINTPIKQQITGTDLVIDLMPIAAKNNYKIFLLGGTPQINQLTEQVLKYTHPDLQIVGTDPGPKFTTKDLHQSSDTFKKIIEKINHSKADILLIAFGAPKQEQFIDQFKDQLNVRLAIGIGGAFDYISGNIKRAPVVMRNLGLEWLFRLIMQPSRITRIFKAVIVFPLTVIFNPKEKPHE